MIRWLILLLLFITLADAGIYHQTDYTVKLENLSYNKSYLHNITCGLVHYNRTYRAINLTGFLIKDLSNNIKVAIQVYKFLSNEYRFFPITMEINGCKELERDTFGIRASYQTSLNVNFHCPFKRGIYKMTYGMINFENFPPYIPEGRYKTEGKFYDDNNFMFDAYYYAEVKEVIKKWE